MKKPVITYLLVEDEDSHVKTMRLGLSLDDPECQVVLVTSQEMARTIVVHKVIPHGTEVWKNADKMNKPPKQCTKDVVVLLDWNVWGNQNTADLAAELNEARISVVDTSSLAELHKRFPNIPWVDKNDFSRAGIGERLRQLAKASVGPEFID